MKTTCALIPFRRPSKPLSGAELAAPCGSPVDERFLPVTPCAFSDGLGYFPPSLFGCFSCSMASSRLRAFCFISNSFSQTKPLSAEDSCNRLGTACLSPLCWFWLADCFSPFKTKCVWGKGRTCFHTEPISPNLCHLQSPRVREPCSDHVQQAPDARRVQVLVRKHPRSLCPPPHLHQPWTRL